MSDDGATAEDGDEEASLVESNSFKAHIGALVWGLNNEVTQAIRGYREI